MVVKERSRRKRPTKRGIISFSLKLGKQKFLKAKYEAIKYEWKDEAKKEK